VVTREREKTINIEPAHDVTEVHPIGSNLTLVIECTTMNGGPANKTNSKILAVFNCYNISAILN
jgi:hypothetical protein